MLLITDVDLDEDGVLGEADCDDTAETGSAFGAQANDEDCDGTLTDDDCDDDDETSTVKEEDEDCDGILTDADCDDENDTSTSKEEDLDCDGLLNEKTQMLMETVGIRMEVLH